MTKYVAVFRSKTDLFDFINKIRYNGGFVETVSTPKEAKIGCGLSARFDANILNFAKTIITRYKYQSFYSIFKVISEGGKITTIRVFP